MKETVVQEPVNDSVKEAQLAHDMAMAAAENENRAVDESLQLIREVSEAMPENNHSTSVERTTGDNVFRGMLIGGLLVAGLIMIIIALLSEDNKDLIIGGVLFSGFGLLLEWLSQAIKKD